MKHLKYFESTIEDAHTQPQIDDYVIAKLNYEKQEFFNTTIGKIVNIKCHYEMPGGRTYAVEYKNIPKSIKDDHCNWREKLNIETYKRIQYQEDRI